MKRIRIHTLLILISTGVITSLGQDNPEESEFKPSGSPFAQIFTNAHTQISEAENESAFEVTRAYFGYEYNLSKLFSAKIILDVGNPESVKSQYTAYLKNAYMKFSHNNFCTYFGMIGTIQFKTQENIWGHRYILRSFQEEYKFGFSADLGISVAYKIHDMICIDAIFMNGEGYKCIQSDSTYRAGAGITITPIKGLMLRGYFDYEKKDEALMNIAAFAGYSDDAISAGMEFNTKNNNKYEKDHNLYGYSAYASYQLNKLLEVFGRYDYLTSNKLISETDSWNISKDGQLFLLGVEFAPVKGIKLTPNYRGWFPSSGGSSLMSWIYLNAEIKF